ncbi:MAG: ABC transporter permease [Planctomycetia bacterium]|nr:ABC transporter permease [Planctomycetia bacterium]
MSLAKLILRSLRFHWRTNVAVMLAVMAASAVLTGALLVGDSMRGSLRHLLLDQLGQIDEVLVTDRFFRPQLAGELESQLSFSDHYSQAIPAVLVQGTVENPRGDGALRAGRVTVLGCDERFWTLGGGGPQKSPGRGEIVLNAPLATEIAASVGDEVLLRIGQVSQIPPDSALGRKTETIRNRRLVVTDIIAAEGLGRFGLHPNQQLPHDAFVATETLQDALEQPGKVNAIFVAGRSGIAPTLDAHDILNANLRPTLVDYGIQLDLHHRGYVRITSNRMLLDPAAVSAVESAFAAEHPQSVFTYLANTIAGGGHEIPYSTITAIDFTSKPPLGPFTTPDGQPIEPLADNEIALNTWAAEDLGIQPGAEIEITFFEPESTHAEVRESKAKFRLKTIAAISGAAADPDLTPQMPGVTDRVSIGDWNAPFPFDSGRVRKKDEKYWDDFRTTPKAFVSLAAGQKLWSSRFGNTTSMRFAPPAGENVAALAAKLKLDPAASGFQFMAVKRMGLMAAEGTTPFDALFVGFSLFIMISALMLIALLFRLGIEQRSAEIGILRAVGLGSRTVAGALASEGFFISAAGSLAGVVAGMGYAWLMLKGLSTWWLSAISTPFLELYVTPRSLAIGYASGVIVSLLTILWTLRRLGHLSVRRLLGRQTDEDGAFARGPSRGGRIVPGAMVIAAAALGVAATGLGGEGQAGAFFGSGALFLAAGLTFIWNCLRAGSTVSLSGPASVPIARLAIRNGARNPSRSTLTVDLIAAASFLIVALSAFRLDPASESRGNNSGSGGFDLVAQSDQPIYQNLNSASGRAELGFSADADELLQKCATVPLRVKAGDDASCLNLYQPTQPRVLGVTDLLVRRGGFAWAASAAQTADEHENPWLLLEKPLPDRADGTNVIPIVLDFNTAQYSFHKGKVGESLEITDGHGRNSKLQIVGLLKNSIFQGDVLCGEKAFLAHFPQVSGYRFFLIDSRGEPIQKVRRTLEGSLGDYGFDAERTVDRLAGFFAVQNTYLSTFQSLGGLGLLLGTFGLATVQLRGVLERRGELALMRAAGFRRALLARLVMIENSLLLIGGLGVGVVAALVAVLPHWLSGGAAVPWLSLALTLGLVLVVGLLSGTIAVRATLRADLLPALREE